MAGVRSNQETALTVLAPAKINLALEVLGKRPDGFHEIRSVIHSVNLCDTLRFQMSRDIEISSDMPAWNSRQSLVSKAVSLLQETAGGSQGAKIMVEKRIPLVSGLGGDSSGAAAALRGLDELWGLGMSRRDMLHLAARLGSDVPFFLYGGAALAEGRGERIAPLPPLPPMWVVLTVPPVPALPEKTAKLYSSLQPGHYTDGRITGRLAQALRDGGEFTPDLLFNAFENVAFAQFAGLKACWEHILKVGAADIHLAGSGPALFTLAKDRAEAEELYVRIRRQGLESYLVETFVTD